MEYLERVGQGSVTLTFGNVSGKFIDHRRAGRSLHKQMITCLDGFKNGPINVPSACEMTRQVRMNKLDRRLPKFIDRLAWQGSWGCKT